MSVLSPDDIAMFRERGFLSPLRLLTAEEAGFYRDRLEGFETEYGRDAPGILRQKSHLVLTWADSLIRHPRILEAVSELLGPNLLCWSTSFFIKNARDPRFVSWHQDSIYWGLDSDEGIASVWVALTPSRPANGCMRMIPGSHRQRITHRETTDPNNFLTHGQTATVDETQALDIALAPGECCLFHPLIVHGSGANPSNERRIGLAIRYVRPERRQTRGEPDSAMLVLGEDRHGHFTLETPPTADASPEALAQHRRVLGAKDGGIYLRKEHHQPGA